MSSDKYNSRRTEPRKFLGYWGSVADLGPGEPLRQNRYNNIPLVTYQTEGQNPQNPLYLGMVWPWHNGARFRYVQFKDAMTEGEICEWQDDVAVTNITSAAADRKSVTLAAAGWTVNQFAGFIFYVTATGNNEGYARYVVENSTDTLYFDDAFPAAFAANDDGILMNPGIVKKHTATQQIPVAGVAVTDITDEYCGWMQIGGVCMRVANDATVITKGMILIPSNATAGTAEPAVAAGPAIETGCPFATALNGSDASEGVIASLWGCV